MKNFDVIVIGTGSAGATAAHKAKAEGLEVAIIDNLPFGGTCALRGCDPKKVLIGAADVLDWSERMQSSGVKGKLSIDWSDLMKFKHSFTDPVPENREKSFESAGISTYHGTASFVDQTTIDVDGEHLSASRNIVIATGALPTVLPIEGVEHLVPSDVFSKKMVTPIQYELTAVKK